MLRHLRWTLVLAVVLISVFHTVGTSFAQEGTPVDEIRRLHIYVEEALQAAGQGDLVKASAKFEQYRAGWPAIEDGVRDTSRDAYRQIEDLIGQARVALAQNDQVAAVQALKELLEVNELFIAGRFSENGASTAPAGTLADVVEKLAEAQEALERGDVAYASKELKEFVFLWPDVEGEVKARSAEIYSATENNVVRAEDMIERGELAAAQQVLMQMQADLEQVAAQPQRYGLFDVMSILLREGLEALLVIAALLAFLTRSGNADKRGWVWAGGGLGVLASVVVGVLLVWAFQGIVTGSNRELVEGITGLIAAAMLFSVSYWLHSKSHMNAWQKYIRDKTNAALATGSLFSLALLAFLSVFREGAETTVMYLGIAPSISTSDLLLGLGLASAILLVIGVLVLWAGVRLPLRLFFLVTSVLIFYLGFKFIGTGIHALQVAQVLPASVSPYLPEGEFLGIFPTWETTVPQLALLLVAAVVVWWTRQSQTRRMRGSAA